MEEFEKVKSNSDEFINILHDIYGFYWDCTNSFQVNLKHFQNSQLDRLRQSNTNIEQLDKASIIIANSPPSDPNSIILHECTQKDFKERMKKDGKNTDYVIQFCLAMVYEHWENKYRLLFVSAIDQNVNDLKSDFFGDIRLIRHDILHCRGIASKQNSCKAKILKWFNENDLIHITEDRFQMIFVEIFRYLNNFFVSHYQIEAYPDHSLSLKGRMKHRNTNHTIL